MKFVEDLQVLVLVPMAASGNLIYSEICISTGLSVLLTSCNFNYSEVYRSTASTGLVPIEASGNLIYSEICRSTASTGLGSNGGFRYSFLHQVLVLAPM